MRTQTFPPFFYGSQLSSADRHYLPNSSVEDIEGDFVHSFERVIAPIFLFLYICQALSADLRNHQIEQDQ